MKTWKKWRKWVKRENELRWQCLKDSGIWKLSNCVLKNILNNRNCGFLGEFLNDRKAFVEYKGEDKGERTIINTVRFPRK